MKISMMYFSPTGTSKKVVRGISKKLSNKYEVNREIDFTLPEERNQEVKFEEDELVIVGLPVYAGRVPNVLLKYLNTVEGNNAIAVAVVLYGNRNYDDALVELRDILKDRGFRVLGAGAFIGEHSFSKILAKGRPDVDDMKLVDEFSEKIVQKLDKNENILDFEVKGQVPYRPYYRPKNPAGEPVDIRKVTPKTNDKCIDCKICAKVCPMGSIKIEDVRKLEGICIKCGACIKSCPLEAKYYDDENYLRHKYELEVEFESRREVELFL